ncbi:SnoaL-like domain-containing protein [Tangfeifania diversioriginum]|uniref:SnoaL-like domain-containing protein n=1 Tax=Tangfeifania diversioriginum TaxID=1168035 RepID=A0A1M6GAS1_9BACT|nr:nuclear transport factor 2 family protein [Tangfeifania diversioriginum]SHJ07051.1 SnoaL-like domain-containing protein [Tangfeifania diversioriginum]
MEPRIIVEEDCGNSPRKHLLKEFNIAFARGDVENILSYVTDDIAWESVGEKRLEGIENFRKELESLKQVEVAELKIENIITHGWIASANGIMHMKNGQTFDFCDVYIFSSAAKNGKLKAIKSYCIQI